MGYPSISKAKELMDSKITSTAYGILDKVSISEDIFSELSTIIIGSIVSAELYVWYFKPDILSLEFIHNIFIIQISTVGLFIAPLVFYFVGHISLVIINFLIFRLFDLTILIQSFLLKVSRGGLSIDLISLVFGSARMDSDKKYANLILNRINKYFDIIGENEIPFTLAKIFVYKRNSSKKYKIDFYNSMERGSMFVFLVLLIIGINIHSSSIIALSIFMTIILFVDLRNKVHDRYEKIFEEMYEILLAENKIISTK